MINFYFADIARIVFALVLAVLPPATQTVSAHAAMLSAGDEIDSMTLTIGAADARPLWVFCSSEERDNVTTANCRAPKMEKLAIGHTFFATDSVFQNADWSELEWEMFIDDQPVNLDAFGTYSYVLPTMAPNPSLIREVFMKFTGWDVVLTDLQPGEHTIDGRVRTEKEEYSWIVNLVIENQSVVQSRSASRGSEHARSGCLRSAGALSPFHSPCRLYGLRSGTIS
jgi:hypothetical protein